jgi:hypothetical protein
VNSLSGVNWSESGVRYALKLLKKWSGRRESNPQPTAWKAVTLPLSYSRLQISELISF